MNPENNAPVGMPSTQPGIVDQPPAPQPPAQPPAPQPQTLATTMMPQQSMMQQPMPAQPVMQPTKPKSRKNLLAIAIVAVILIAALAGTGYFVVTRSSYPSITTSVNSADYTQITSLDGASFWMSKQWTIPTPATNDHIDALNYGTAKVDAELQAAGHLTDYEDGRASDIQPRQLKTYPYSLDKMYEVQVLVTPSFPAKQQSKDEIMSTLGPSNVKDLQFYRVNGKLVSDFILLGHGKAVDQRIITMRNSENTRDVMITINHDQSMNITKDNFDGLMELVGSITFK